jgi:hypothetical protein
MGAYSSLCLVANTGFRIPDPAELHTLFAETGLLNPARADKEFGNLTPEFWNYFDTLPERAQNDWLFRPDGISGHNRVEIHDPEGSYERPGFAISISGQGYFWPLSMEDLRQIVHQPKLRQLATEVAVRFGGEFLMPRFRGKKILERTLIDRSGPWFWFGSQTM